MCQVCSMLVGMEGNERARALGVKLREDQGWGKEAEE